jgi:hypothetical protein
LAFSDIEIAEASSNAKPDAPAATGLEFARMLGKEVVTAVQWGMATLKWERVILPAVGVAAIFVPILGWAPMVFAVVGHGIPAVIAKMKYGRPLSPSQRILQFMILSIYGLPGLLWNYGLHLSPEFATLAVVAAAVIGLFNQDLQTAFDRRIFRQMLLTKDLHEIVGAEEAVPLGSVNHDDSVLKSMLLTSTVESQQASAETLREVNKIRTAVEVIHEAA